MLFQLAQRLHLEEIKDLARLIILLEEQIEPGIGGDFDSAEGGGPLAGGRPPLAGSSPFCWCGARTFFVRTFAVGFAAFLRGGPAGGLFFVATFLATFFKAPDRRAPSGDAELQGCPHDFLFRHQPA